MVLLATVVTSIGALIMAIYKVFKPIRDAYEKIQQTQAIVAQHDACDVKMTKSIHALEQSFELLRRGELSILRSKIKGTCVKMKARGYVRIWEAEMVEDLYQTYKALGGNGSITKLYQEITKLETKE